MSETPNPYQAPLDESLSADASREPEELISVRMDFDGRVDVQDHRDAVVRAGIRKDYSSMATSVVALSIGYVFCVTALMALAGQFGALSWMHIAVGALLMVFGLFAVAWNQRRFLANVVPGFQLITGDIQGWIDRDGVRIRSKHYEAFHPLSQLVSCAATHDLFVLNFTQDQLFWVTIPIDAFADPRLARSIAAEFQQIRPPIVATSRDLRRMSEPTAQPLFLPQPDAVRYHGPLHDASSRGTGLLRASRRIAMRAWVSLAALLACTVLSFLVMAGGVRWLVLLMLLWLLVLVIMVVIKSTRARRQARGKGGQVSWHSAGWLDGYGYCSMTAIGQMRVAWDGFDHFEVTDQAIALYPHRSDGCCCLVGREQFEDESLWRGAIDRVKAGMAAVRSGLD